LNTSNYQTHGPTRPAPDAAGAARNLVRFSCTSRAVARLDLLKLPAAQVRRTLGRSHPIKRSPDRLRSQTSPGITEHIPNIFRAFPGISGHRRTRNDHRVPYRSSPVTPSRMARRGGIARRLIACDQARRVRYRRSPVTASGMVVACRIVRRRIVCRRARRLIAYRHVPACCGDLGVPAVFTVGRAEDPSAAMSRPNSAL